MSTRWIKIGLVVIVVMCLFPPVESVDAVAVGLNEMLGVSGDATQIEYRPVWAMGTGTLAAPRLILQVLVAAVVFGGIAAVTGGGDS